MRTRSSQVKLNYELLCIYSLHNFQKLVYSRKLYLYLQNYLFIHGKNVCFILTIRVVVLSVLVHIADIISFTIPILLGSNRKHTQTDKA